MAASVVDVRLERRVDHGPEVDVGNLACNNIQKSKKKAKKKKKKKKKKKHGMSKGGIPATPLLLAKRARPAYLQEVRA